MIFVPEGEVCADLTVSREESPSSSHRAAGGGRSTVIDRSVRRGDL
jgi:hypothetical protein